MVIIVQQVFVAEVVVYHLVDGSPIGKSAHIAVINPDVGLQLTRIMVVVTRNIPVGATFKVEVCNNYFDTNKVWENATEAVLSGLVHVFSNKVKTSSQWGVVVRVTVNRNGATGACYVSAIGGNFE